MASEKSSDKKKNGHNGHNGHNGKNGHAVLSEKGYQIGRAHV